VKVSKRFFLMLFMVFTIGLLGIGLWLSLLLNEAPSDTSGPKRLGKTTVLAIGCSTSLFEEVTKAMENRGANVSYLEDVPDFTEGIDEGVVVMFDGDWLEENLENYTFHDFLRKCVSERSKLTTVGGRTSLFFEALDKAEVNKLYRDENGNSRNPAYFDPPLVGFKIVETTTPEGPNVYPSILISNTNNVDTMIQALFDW